MSFVSTIERLIRTVTPLRRRGLGGPFIQVIPNGAAQQLPLHMTPGIAAWGALTQLLSATANTTDCWLETLVVSQATGAATEYNIGLTMEAGIAAPTVAQLEGCFGGFMGLTLDQHFHKIDPPIYIRQGQRIAAALAGTKKVDVWVIISRNK